MTTRILPPDEWSKLEGTELEQAYPFLDPKESFVLVVEDGDRIVGTWAALRQVHLEGVWVHPDHRGRGAVATHLLRAMGNAVAEKFGVEVAWTAAANEDVANLITKHLKGIELPGQHFVVPIGAG